MKLSKYNFIYRYEDDSNFYIAYNSFSNVLAVLSSGEYEELINLENNGILKKGDMSDFVKGHFVVDDDVDEINLIREHMLKARYDTSALGLTIAPTLNCNFRCVYCFENGCVKENNMTEDIQLSVIKYIENHAGTIDHLDIAWYGGEPLLAIKIIEEMSASIIEICNKNNIQYSSAIVTNGYLLDEKMVQRLIACKINRCQVTIDGTREEHNARRPHVSGTDTYDTIIKNVCDASEFMCLSVRVNIDKNNLNSIYELQTYFEEKTNHNVLVYPAPIRNNNNCFPEETCLEIEEFLKYDSSYHEKICSSEDSNNMYYAWSKYPKQRTNSCCADSISGYVINANGDIYKCWSDIGRDELCIGNIQEGVFKESKSIRYSQYDPTRDEKCNLCKFLPICMGGCPRDVIDHPNDRCIYTDEILKRHLNIMVKKRLHGGMHK